MRRLVLLATLAFSFLAVPAFAADTTYTSFSSDITVNTDASISVTETVVVDFNVAKHGIFRNIPFRYDTGNGGSISVPIEDVRVLQDSSEATFTTSKQGKNVVLKIGDADRTLTGSHTYIISYTAQAAVNFFDDHDELYWNVTGDDWEAPISKVSATVHLPSDVAAADVQAACYTGTQGSKEQDCESTTASSVVTFTAPTFLTAVVGWPKGIVTKPADYDTIRSSTSTRVFVAPLSHTAWLAILVGNLLAAAAIVAWFVRWWLTHGRDPKSRGTVIAQYDPPDGLRPGEVGTLYDEKAETRDVIATIVDLAVRGYLVIEEGEKKGFLGIGGGKDYTLLRKKQPDQALKPYEEKLMSSLFKDGESVKLSELKGSFANDLHAVQKLMYEQTVTDGYFSANPDSVRKKYFIIGLLLFFLGSGLMVVFIFVLPLAGILAMLVAKAMPQRTAKGVEAAWHSRGFREFLHTAERYRLKWQEKEHIFEQYLPYAMVFGVAEQWTKTFKDIAMEQPSWYHGSPGSMFNSLVLWSALSNFSTTATQSFVPPAATGSSGFGGGGFSGGGFGGGGGGSW